jgi:hypothetical protein
LKTKKAILCLAAGISQKSLIVKAKSLGYYVLAIDIDKNAIGFNFSDSYIVESTHEPFKIIDKLKKYINDFDWVGIINRSSGYPVKTVAILSDFLNIPSFPVISADIIINKNKLKSSCIKHNIPVGDFKIFSVNDKEINTKSFKYPLVTKPGLSLIGKKGITVIDNQNQLCKGIEYAKKFTVNNNIILEEYLPGPDFTLVSFVDKNSIIPICILDELNTEDIDGKIISRGYKTHAQSLDNMLENEILSLSKKIIEKFKISRSSIMTCFRLGNDNHLKLMEIHLDLGGDLLIEELFPKALKFDFEILAIEILSGNWDKRINTSVKPTEIFYEKGEALLNQRPFKILQAQTFEELDKKIINKSL